MMKINYGKEATKIFDQYIDIGQYLRSEEIEQMEKDINRAIEKKQKGGE
jgi:hypothetical protein